MKPHDYLSRIKAGELLLWDGAWGTQLQKAGLQPGACPEEWNLTHPDEVEKVAKAYFESGCDLGLTNTFGGSKFRLQRHGLADQLTAINRAGAAISKRAAQAYNVCLVGSIGPSGEYAEPKGLVSKSEFFEAFRKQMLALQSEGIEAVLIETFSALDEIEQAILAAKDLGLFCMASMTFDHGSSGFKTMTGVSVQEATLALDQMGVDVIGTNCGHGIQDMVAIVQEMRPHSQKPILVRSNAGLPKINNGEATYAETPEWMAQRIKPLVQAGASLIGGCCGTTPEHIRQFRKVLDQIKAAQT